MKRICKITLLKVLIGILPIVIVSTIFTYTVRASTLNLLGVGWDKTEVTYLIKKGKNVTEVTVEDVKTAIADWNTALGDKSINLTLLPAPVGARNADVVIQLKVGGGAVLGQTLTKTVSSFSCELKSVSIQLSGKAFGQNFSDAGTRNVARHELGHALGLGHSDDLNDLMYASAESSDIFGNIDQPISDCDKKGLDDIYPLPPNCNIPDSTNCP